MMCGDRLEFQGQVAGLRQESRDQLLRGPVSHIEEFSVVLKSVENGFKRDKRSLSSSHGEEARAQRPLSAISPIRWWPEWGARVVEGKG